MGSQMADGKTIILRLEINTIRLNSAGLLQQSRRLTAILLRLTSYIRTKTKAFAI